MRTDTNFLQDGPDKGGQKFRNQDPTDLMIAILAFFDFAAAFPSVAHTWLFAVLTASGAPEWFINYVSALYAGNVTYHMNSYIYTDKTTRCVIRSLSGRGLWLGGQSNHSINQSANQSITQSIHQLNKQSVEIIC